MNELQVSNVCVCMDWYGCMRVMCISSKCGRSVFSASKRIVLLVGRNKNIVIISCELERYYIMNDSNDFIISTNVMRLKCQHCS